MKKNRILFLALWGFLLGAACPAFAQPLLFTKTTLAVGSGPSYVLAADLTGSGLPDLVCPDFGFRYGCLGDYGNNGSNLTLWVNNGHGVFSSRTTIKVGDAALSYQPEPSCVAAADFNGTGHLDLVEPNFVFNTLEIFTNNGAGVFKAGAGFSAYGRQPIFITTADVNGDGRPDIISVNNNTADHNVTVLTNGGNFVFSNSATLTVGIGPVSLAVADINGDGLPDLICANYGTNCGGGDTLTIYTNYGQGHFGFSATLTVGNDPVGVVAADVNGDGKIDLITANQSDNTLSVLTNDGAGNFTLQTNIPAFSPSSLVATNLSGDGSVDLACANSDNGYAGSVTIWLNDGRGNFTSNNIVMLDGPDDNYPDSITAGDFNGDGKMDLAVANYGTATLTVLTQKGAAVVSNNRPPVVNITNPTNGASFFTNENLVIQATATPAASITAVAFYLDGNPVGTVKAAPYSLTIAASSIALGGHNLEATALDSAGLMSTSGVVHVTVNAPGTSLIDFDAVDASAGAVGGATLSDYLAGYGVTVAGVTVGAALEAVNVNQIKGPVQVLAPSPPNIFTEAGASGPVSFTLLFAAPLQSFGFTRAGLSPRTGFVSHPQWTATAFDAGGAELSSMTEALILSPSAVQERSFVLTGKGIASVRFDSDSQQTAAFSAVLLDDLILNSNPATHPLSVTLSVVSPATNDIGAGTAITLEARVADLLSSSSYVSFFAGATLLGTASNSPYELTLSGLLPGNYNLQAFLADSSGYSVPSAVVPITVQLPPFSKVVNFDSLNTSRGPVEGLAVNEYLASFGATVSSLSPGTALTVDSQQHIAGGDAVLASSPPNILTQTGANGPVQFTLSFRPWLSQFGFTRPELLADPFVSHPAWQVTAFDGAGNVVGQVGEPEIDSSTNVGAQEFSLGGAGGPGIANVEFSSEGSGLTTFNAMLVDDLILTTNTAAFPPAVAITQPAPHQTFAAPPALTISANASDAAGIRQVSFYAGKVLLGTSTASPYAITWPNPAIGNYYLKAVASDAAGLATTSSLVNITITASANQFAILSQPAGQAIAAGGSVTFAVATTGASAVSYQWYLNGQAIPGATSATLILPPPIQDADAGTYTVAATSGGTTLTSEGAVLTVVDPPIFTTQPQGQTVAPGTTVVLSAAADNGPVTWQWLLNGVTIPGATNDSFVIPAAQPQRSGNYQAVAANLAASALSDVASVIVETPITIPETNDNFANRASISLLKGSLSDSNESATVEPGEPLPDGQPGGNSIWFTWHATFTGIVSLTTQGSDFHTLLAVYTGASLSKLKVVAADNDSAGFLNSLVTFNVVSNTDYQIAVDGYEGASGRVVLGLAAGTGYRVLNPSAKDTVPVIVKGPVNQVVAPNARVTFSVQATSPTPLSCQWLFQREPIPGATGSTLVISHAQPGAVGEYAVLLANAVGSAQSEAATLQIAVNQIGTASALEPNAGGSRATASPAALAYVIRPSDSGGDVRGYAVAQIFSTVGATREPDEPQPCGQVGGSPEWFSYTAEEPGTLLINTAGSTFNTLLGVYTGPGTSFSNLVEVGCGYTTDYALEGQPSVVLPSVDKGTTFYILVDGYHGANGVVRLQIGLGRPLSFSSLPPSQTVTAETGATFSAAAAGSEPISYQWQLNGVNVPGATKSTFTIAKAILEAEGNYTVIASNALGAVTSSPPASLTVRYAPAITAEPTNLTVTEGQSARFTVSAAGVNVKTNPLICQWFFNQAPIPKATSLSLFLPVTRLTNAGTYSLVISNSYGSVTSSPATLVVQAKAARKEAVSPEGVTYSGLFHPASGATLASSGFFTATVGGGKSRVLSASILLDGGSYPLAGQLDSSGNAQFVIPRPGKTPVTASLRLALDPPGEAMSGVISNAEWCSILQAGRVSFDAARNSDNHYAGQFTLVVPWGTNAPMGYLDISNTLGGTALITGTLPDGARLFRAAPIAQGAGIPLYIPLYSGQGMFLGWIPLPNSPEENLGKLEWLGPGATNATTVRMVK